MAPRGTKPKPAGDVRFRGVRMHGWTEVDDKPLERGPSLPPRRRDGQPWPEWMQEKWDAWRSMPHAALWAGVDWQFALDTAELAASAFQEDLRIGVMAELRLREKAMGTTWAARQDMHIRYVERPDESRPASVMNLEDYRDL